MHVCILVRVEYSQDNESHFKKYIPMSTIFKEKILKYIPYMIIRKEDKDKGE